MRRSNRCLVAVLLLGLHAAPGAAQSARVWEAPRSLLTYPFSDPDPVPILARDSRLYPYHTFEGYSTEAVPMDWQVVTLENDHIQVFVLPEVGGKVWGAVVKGTGHEFIYRNEVMKFRNISLRGPWTSGGIEFNFGVIGHTPATATPVDYGLVENPDGSVSCWVGGMDLPSRTHWRVEVRLEPDRASFDTNVFWYNPTPLEQPYYNWMTAAAFAQDDLELSIPGNAYLQHSGNVLDWPTDSLGRYLPAYRSNTFEGHKSYHVVGELNDFFGGYYLDDDYGFGHWARYEDMPGQKLWMWALSRQGGVWEDLLTDTDGQYVEFQAGRLFVQYSPGPEINPITQVGFEPMSTSRWTESWFPLEGIGGLTDASRDGALATEVKDGTLTVAVNAFRPVRDTLRVWLDGGLVAEEPVGLSVLEPARFAFDMSGAGAYRIQLFALDLDYRSDPADRTLSRPFATDPGAFPSMPETDRLLLKSRELMQGRWYGDARDGFEAVIAREPFNRAALLGLGELEYRAGRYADGLAYVNRALQLDAYDAAANFLAGAHYRAMGRAADARDAFGWAARSPAFRSGAFTELAGIMVGLADWPEATRNARLALDYDRYNVPAWQILAVVGRVTGDETLAVEAREGLLALDPLSHFARAERYLAAPTAEAGAVFASTLGGEYPDQTALELAIGYARMERPDDGVAVLEAAETAADGAVLRAWTAWLAGDPNRLPTKPEPSFQFPYRPETLSILAWAVEHRGTAADQPGTASAGAWVWHYLLALNHWAVGRQQEAAALMAELAQTPDYGAFYVARAALQQSLRHTDPVPDLDRAVAIDPDSRLLHVARIRVLEDRGAWWEALAALDPARQRFPDDFNLALLHARALIHSGGALEAVAILTRTQVLPSENARESHLLYERAHTLVALDALESGDLAEAKEHLEAALLWPETLGQGRPYEPEERLVRFLLGVAEAGLGNQGAAEAAFRAVVDASPGVPALAYLGETAAAADGGWRLDLLGAVALRELASDAGVDWLDREEDVGAAAAERYPGAFEDLEGSMLRRALGMR